jgi:hypothetical protein
VPDEVESTQVHNDYCVYAIERPLHSYMCVLLMFDYLGKMFDVLVLFSGDCNMIFRFFSRRNRDLLHTVFFCYKGMFKVL